LEVGVVVVPIAISEPPEVVESISVCANAWSNHFKAKAETAPLNKYRIASRRFMRLAMKRDTSSRIFLVPIFFTPVVSVGQRSSAVKSIHWQA
jgi:hypothetical protein